MKQIIKKYKYIIVLLTLTIIFASSSLVLTYDSTHYLTYVNILDGNVPFSNWDIARGPIFPIIIYINNFIFGRSGLGMLMGMFIYYLIYCLIVYIFSKEIFKNLKHKNIFVFITCLFSFLNPIILGYYHVMLTEYVAITLTMTSLYIGWKWHNEKDKNKKILYSLYFIFGITFSYFLKQPYVCVVIIPMIISIIYAIIKNRKRSNVLYYSGTLLASIIVLISSILLWNKFLEHKGVNLKTGRDSSGMLTSQILNAIDGYKVVKDYDYSNVDNDKYLTKKEKETIKKEIKKNNEFYIIEIYRNKKLLEKDILKLSTGNKPSAKDTMLEITSTLFKYPDIIIGSYAKNYCGLSSLCVITSDDGVMYSVTSELDFVKMFENEIIPFKSFKKEQKHFYYPEEREELVKGYISPINQGTISKIMTKTFTITSILFKFFIFLSFLFIIVLIIFRIIVRKKIKNKELYLLSLMLLSTSFLTIVANAFVGAMIDRYSVVCFIPSILGFAGMVIFIIKNVSRKESKK